jgi:MscS family membrane protein
MGVTMKNRYGVIRIAIGLTLFLTFTTLFACVQAEPDHQVRAYPKDDQKSYSREVVVGTVAKSSWVVINSDNISSYNVRISLAGDTGTWNVTVSPTTFMLSPGSAEEVTVSYRPITANLGESKTLEVNFNYTQITSVSEPISYSETKTASYLVVVKSTAEKHGVDATMWGYLLFHIDLPDYLDNNIGHFLTQVVLWIIFAFIAIGIFLPVMKLITSKTKTKYDDIMLNIIRNPIIYGIILYGLADSLGALGVPPDVHAWIYKAVSIVIITMVAFVSYRVFKIVIIAWMMEKARKTQSKLDDVLVPLLDKLGTVAIVIIACVYLLSYSGINVTVIVAGMGMAGLVIGLAAQDTLSNFFAGIHLLLDRPFEMGDTIMLDNGDYCEVWHVGLRSTRLYNRFTHDEVSMPNNKIANMQINNVSRPDKSEMFKVEVGVAYGTDLEKVEKILLDIGNKHPDVMNEKDVKPYVRLNSFGDNSVNYALWVRGKDFSTRWRVAHEMRKEIYNRFIKEGIDIPFPQRVVHIKKEK